MAGWCNGSTCAVYVKDQPQQVGGLPMPRVKHLVLRVEGLGRKFLLLLIVDFLLDVTPRNRGCCCIILVQHVVQQTDGSLHAALEVLRSDTLLRLSV